jgi:hypothetical protein
MLILIMVRWDCSSKGGYSMRSFNKCTHASKATGRVVLKAALAAAEKAVPMLMAGWTTGVAPAAVRAVRRNLTWASSSSYRSMATFWMGPDSMAFLQPVGATPPVPHRLEGMGWPVAAQE